MAAVAPSRTAEERAELVQGLLALKDAPVKSGYIQLDATLNPLELAARLSAGLHPTSSTTVFGFAQASTLSGLGAGLGARWEF